MKSNSRAVFKIGKKECLKLKISRLTVFVRREGAKEEKEGRGDDDDVQRSAPVHHFCYDKGQLLHLLLQAQL